MNGKLKKLIYIFFIIIFIIDINTCSYAKAHQYTQEEIDKLAKDYKTLLKITNDNPPKDKYGNTLDEAIVIAIKQKNNPIDPNYIKNVCYKTIETGCPGFKEFRSSKLTENFLKKEGKRENGSNDYSKIYTKIREYNDGKKSKLDTNKIYNASVLYWQLYDIQQTIDEGLKDNNNANELKDSDTVKKIQSLGAKEIVEKFVKDYDCSLGILQNDEKNGKKIINSWYDKIINNKTSSITELKNANCWFTDVKSGLRYNEAFNKLCDALTMAKGEKVADREYIYVQPGQSENDTSSEASLEDMVNDADAFIKNGNVKYDTNSMQNFSKTMYNILLTVGIFAATIVGGIIGIKLMTSSAEGKADAKKLLVPYIVGCIVVFGGFGIWKIVVTILQNV